MITASILAGAIGNIFFGFKSIFQVIKNRKAKSTEGLSMGMIMSDFIGNICCAYYIYTGAGFELWFQFVNYGFATLFLFVLLYQKYKYKPLKNKLENNK